MSFSCVLFGAFWLDPGEGCENMRAPAPACSLARALRALAGGLSKERLGRLALLGNASVILPKTLPEASRDLPKLTLALLGLILPLLGVIWGLLALILDLLGLTLSVLGRSWGSPGALWGASGELLEPPKASQIAPGGSPGGPPHRSLIFEAFWEPFWLHFGTPRSSKNKVFVWRVLHFSKKSEGFEKNT